MKNNYRVQEISCCNNCDNKVQQWEWIECSLTYDKEEDFAETVNPFGICDKWIKEEEEFNPRVQFCAICIHSSVYGNNILCCNLDHKTEIDGICDKYVKEGLNEYE